MPAYQEGTYYPGLGTYQPDGSFKVQEGDTRYNQMTGQNETYTPGGVWNAIGMPSTPAFNPQMGNTVSTGAANEALSNPTTLPAAAERSISQQGSLIRGTGQDTVYQIQGDTLRGFTSPQALYNSGFNFTQVKEVAPSLIDSFRKGAPITDVINQSTAANNFPTILDYQTMSQAANSYFGVPGLETALSNSSQKLVDLYNNLPDNTRNARAQAYTQYNVLAKQGAISNLDKQILQYQESVGLTSEALRNQPGVVNVIIQGQEALLQRQSDIHLKSLFAQKAAAEGDYQNALTLAGQAVQDATNDQLSRIEGLKFVLNQQQSTLNRADQKSASALSFALDQQKAKLLRDQQLQDQKTQVYLSLIQKYPNAELNPGMTLDEMVASVKPFASVQEKLALDKAKMDLLSTTTDIAYKQAQTSAIPADIALKQAQAQQARGQAAYDLARALQVNNQNAGYGSVNDLPPAPGLRSSGFTPMEQQILNGLNANEIVDAQGIASYTLDPTKVSSLRQNRREALIAAAKVLNPKFNMLDYPAKAQLQKNFTSGKYADNILAMNTLVDHLRELYNASIDLNNGNFTPINAATNIKRTLSSDPRIAAYKKADLAVSEELDRVFKGAQTSEKLIRDWKESQSINNGLGAQKAGIKEAAKLMMDRLSELNQIYTRSFGRDYPMLQQDTIDTLRFMGIEPTQDALKTVQAQAVDTVGTQNGFSVTLPDGSTATFNSQQDLDNFKRDAGL